VKASRALYLGAALPPQGGSAAHLLLPPEHLVTHGVVVGMTGSGKTGLLMVMIEEALRADIPVIMVDIKGDLPNLLLAFPSFAKEHFLPWVEGLQSTEDGSPGELAQKLADERKRNLEAWQVPESVLADFRAKRRVQLLTPGANIGQPLHMLSSLERPSGSWDTDPDACLSALVASVTLLLRLMGRESDPSKSREHVMLSVLAERRLRLGQTATLEALIADLQNPPIFRVGALEVNSFLAARERKLLAAALNTVLASPTFAHWREGCSMDVKDWMTTKDGITPATIVSVAHLDDDERNVVLGVLLQEILSCTRSLSGSQRMRALVVLDEVYGLLPPHPQNPPTKRPLVSLMKQARAFGVGVVVATQNPMDLDYRALSNAGFWAVGRLQTDADRGRMVESLSSDAREKSLQPKELSSILRHLAPRWFLVRDVHSREGTTLLHPRWALSFLRGPMTHNELRRAAQAA
jgi:hypothetical protein